MFRNELGKDGVAHNRARFFFHDCRIIGHTLENQNWQKWSPRDFSKKSLIIVHKAPFVSVKSYNFVEDVWVHSCSEMSWVRQELLTGS